MLFLFLASVGWADDGASVAGRDPRNLRLGLPIPSEGYCDQPYVVVTPEGHWVCTMTTGPGREGDRGQHVVATISTDQGRTWSKLIDIEPSDGPEASWIVPLITPSGRIYGFYTYNGDDVRKLNGRSIRADTIGWYAMKYSDDGGRSWSAQRYRLPLRVTACDRGNDFGGAVQIFWGIDKPNVAGRDAVFAFTKLGKYMLELGEGWIFRSDNLLTESDPDRIRWELLPSGDRGIRKEEFGSIQEEHNLVPIGDSDLYCVYRTTRGFPCHAYSRDGGRTWTEPEPMVDAPGGRMIKTPRACPMLWRTSDGRLLFWFHHNSERSFQSRNPAWIAGGIVRDGHVYWSQPEILLYDPDPKQRMSYPDLIEQNGRFWVTATQKTDARVHEIDRTLLDGLWNQGKAHSVSRDGLIADLDATALADGPVALAKPTDLSRQTGLSIELWLRLPEITPGQVLLSTLDAEGRGWSLAVGPDKNVQWSLGDGRRQAVWTSDAGTLAAGRLQHVVAIVDSGPQMIQFVIDGRLGDGGSQRDYGWTRYAEPLADVSGTGSLCSGEDSAGPIARVRVYDRYLRVSEAVAHYHAERPESP